MSDKLKATLKDKYKILKRLVTLFASAVMILNLGLVKTVEGNMLDQGYYQPVERFGITAPLGFSGYDIESLNVRAALDWGADSSFPLPPDVEYIHVLRVRNDLYDSVLVSLPTLIAANPGEVWIIGNEPDTTFGNQDNLFPEVYAARYYEIATAIRTLDPTAKIVFGSIVQPTPIRLHYLDLALDELASLSGGQENALALIDIWCIHAFILNEQVDDPDNFWGTGLPPGFQPDWGEPLIILIHSDIAETYSIDMFKGFVEQFRIWLTSKGEQNKPLWITEYGSLFPARETPPLGYPGWPNTQDTINYMTDTFNFLLSEADSSTGFPADADHLVQRWFWYSLNDHLDSFGGSLFDPDNNKEITLVGEAFRAYTNQINPKFVFLPLVKR